MKREIATSQLRSNEVDIDTNLLQSMHIRLKGETTKKKLGTNIRRRSNFMNSNTVDQLAVSIASSSYKWRLANTKKRKQIAARKTRRKTLKLKWPVNKMLKQYMTNRLLPARRLELERIESNQNQMAIGNDEQTTNEIAECLNQ